MANKYIEQYPTSFVITKYNQNHNELVLYTPTMMVIINSQVIKNVGKDAEKLEFLYTAGGNIKW